MDINMALDTKEWNQTMPGRGLTPVPGPVCVCLCVREGRTGNHGGRHSKAKKVRGPVWRIEAVYVSSALQSNDVESDLLEIGHNVILGSLLQLFFPQVEVKMVHRACSLLEAGCHGKRSRWGLPDIYGSSLCLDSLPPPTFLLVSMGKPPWNFITDQTSPLDSFHTQLKRQSPFKDVMKCPLMIRIPKWGWNVAGQALENGNWYWNIVWLALLHVHLVQVFIQTLHLVLSTCLHSQVLGG